MNIINQNKLYGLHKFFNQFKYHFDNNNMPNKILFSGKKGVGKHTLANHIINYVLSIDEENKYDFKNFEINQNNRSNLLIKNHTHPNFYLIDLIDEKKNIEINQIRNLINQVNKSSFNTSPRFILINNVENLNLNSSNALLKIVEEPNENLYFILIHNSNKKILQTLKSRCLMFNIYLSFNETIKVTNELLDNNLSNLLHSDFINYYFSTGDYFALLNFSNEKKIDIKNFNLSEFLNFIINGNYYKKNKSIKDLLLNYIELYILNIFKKNSGKSYIINIYSDMINKIKNSNEFNLDEESLFIEFKSKFLNG